MLSGARCALFLLVPHMRPGTVLAGILLLVFCGSLVYSVLQMIAASKFLTVKPAALRAAEPISVLKPLAGLDLDLESNLRTFFEQDYPAFEILFAVRNESDPAVAVVRRLQLAYPKTAFAARGHGRTAVSECQGFQPGAYAGRCCQRSGGDER